MAVKSPARSHMAPADHKELVKLGQALGASDSTVKLVTYEPEAEVVAVFVDAAKDKSAHELALAVIDAWLAWLPRVDEGLEFTLLNLSEVHSQRSRNNMMAAYQGEILFDRRCRFRVKS